MPLLYLTKLIKILSLNMQLKIFPWESLNYFFVFLLESGSKHGSTLNNGLLILITKAMHTHCKKKKDSEVIK